MQKKEQHIRAGLTVAVMTMLSRVFGLVRDMCFAWFLGAGQTTDIFFIAFKIPNFFRRLFAEGAFAQSFVPVLTEYKEHHTLAELKNFISATASSLSMILLVFTLLVIMCSQWISYLFAPGFMDDPEKMHVISHALQITFPYLFFIALTAFMSSILNVYQHFMLPSLAPLILNLCLISTVFLTVYTDQPVLALSWSVFLAGLLQLFLQVPLLLRMKLFPVFTYHFWKSWKNPGVKKVITLMLPTLFAVSVTQLSLLIDTVLASFLIPGSISWLYYADRLVELPLGILAIAIATVILPSLSKKYQHKDSTAFTETLNWAIRLVLFMGLPAALALMTLADTMINTLFGYRAMTLADINQTASALRAYSLGLIAFMLIKVLAPAYFAQQNTKTPVKIGVTASITNILLSLLLIMPLAHSGLALATSLAAMLNAAMLAYGLWRRNILSVVKSQMVYYARVTGSSLIMVAVIWVMSQYLFFHTDGDMLIRWFYLLLYCMTGIVVYLMAAHVLGIRKGDLVA